MPIGTGWVEGRETNGRWSNRQSHPPGLVVRKKTDRWELVKGRLRLVVQGPICPNGPTSTGHSYRGVAVEVARKSSCSYSGFATALLLVHCSVHKHSRIVDQTHHLLTPPDPKSSKYHPNSLWYYCPTSPLLSLPT